MAKNIAKTSATAGLDALSKGLQRAKAQIKPAGGRSSVLARSSAEHNLKSMSDALSPFPMSGGA